MITPKIVIDPNIVLSGLRSNRRASYLFLESILKSLFTFGISPALVPEYEDVLKRHSGKDIEQSPNNIDDILDYLCSVGEHTKIYYLWRPHGLSENSGCTKFAQSAKDNKTYKTKFYHRDDPVFTHRLFL